MEKNVLCDNLQNKVDEVLIRHKSILDVMSKLEESNSRINRAIVKSVTSCGCINIDANKQVVPSDSTLSEAREFFKDHVSGDLCENCREIVSKEIGNHMFYISALCNVLDLKLNEITLNELNKLNTLGVYSLL